MAQFVFYSAIQRVLRVIALQIKMNLHNSITCGIVLIISSFINSSLAQIVFPPDSVKHKISASPITRNIKIDGALNESEWALAQFIPEFIQMDPFQGSPARKKTKVRLLYNKTYLYVAAICYDTVGKANYRVPNFKRDFGNGSGDDFSIAIDGYNDERNAVSFTTNAYGVQSDLVSFDDNYYDTDWDGLWVVRTQRTDTAWIAEIAIPWKTLRYKINRDSLQTWGISFSRMARADNELSAWPAFPRAYSPLRMAYAGKLININAPAPSGNIRVQPYTLYSYAQSKYNNTVTETNNSIKPGGDIKWALNPNTLLDLTFNTDFAQADVDRKVNNINRFSVFFPERRQFFLENAGLFAVGIDPLPGNGLAEYSARIQPFFSRSIGLDSNGRPLPIPAGARFINRTKKQNIGALLVKQDGNSVYNNAAYIVAGRYSRNFGKQNRIGALVTYKTSENKLIPTTDFSATIDGFIRFNQALSVSYMGSVNKNSVINKNGYAASAQLIYNTNTLVAWWSQSINTENYKPQMGFVARNNVIITEPGMYYQIRAKWLPKFVRAIFPGISYITYHNTTTGKLTDRYFNFIPLWCRFQNRSLIFYNYTATQQNLETGFNLLGEPLQKGVYNYYRHKFGYTSDLSKKVSYAVTANLGSFYNGHFNSVTATVNIAPFPNFFLSPSVETGKLKNFGTSRVSKKVELYSIECRAALNPRLQLTGLFQKSSIINSVNWNVRFAWEFKPLSFFYIVYNNNTFERASKLNDQQVIVKFSYLKQF